MRKSGGIREFASGDVKVSHPRPCGSLYLVSCLLIMTFKLM